MPSQLGFTHGQQTVGTSSIQLTSSSNGAKIGVLVKANDDNTGTVYVGKDANVSSSNGFELGAGESVEIEVHDTLAIFLIASAAGQGVTWVAV